VAVPFHESGRGTGGEPMKEQCGGVAGDERQWRSTTRKEKTGQVRRLVLGWHRKKINRASGILGLNQIPNRKAVKEKIFEL
jgi:hypothetical protein